MTSWRSTIAFKQKGEGKEDGGEGEIARPFEFVSLDQQRKQKWKSFMSNLEDECCQEDAAEIGQGQTQLPKAKGGEEATPGKETEGVKENGDRGQSLMPGRNFSSISSLYMQQLRGDIHLGLGDGNTPKNISAPIVTLPPTLPLRDWVEHHANCNRTSLSRMGMGKQIDKAYLEDAAAVALSLARKLLECCGEGSALVRNEDITIDNVIVSDTKSGDIEFVVRRPRCGSDGDYPAQDPSQRSKICALGRIYYEVFTQGTPCEVSTKQQFAPAPTSDENAFDVALKITSVDDAQPDDRVEKRKHPRRESESDCPSRYTTLQTLGLPPSISRLVADMLANQEGQGDLFRPDRSVSSLTDVVCDLEHMVDDPNSYLHDSLLMRLEPVVQDKLYGRETELRACLEVAEDVSKQTPAEMFTPQSVIMISGFSGSGKSTLVREVSTQLCKLGWRCLQCKFPQEVRLQPLSTITSAFDHFLEDIARGMLENGDKQGIVDQVTNSFDDSDMNVLCGLIPALRKLVPVARETPKPNESSFSSGDANASKCRLHFLLGLLVRALSSPMEPLVVVMDDLQFSDMASLEVINSLVEGVQYEDSTSDNRGSQHVMFVGCYRNNVVSDSDPLAVSIQQMSESSTIRLKEISLDRLSSEDVNAIVGDSLFCPHRLTRSLSSLIHQKSAGNPLFVKEFSHSMLTLHILSCSLSRHQWMWDEDVIQMKAVFNGVGDLLSGRLKILPKDVLASLQVMSCFYVLSSDLLVYVKNNVCGVSDIVAGLDSAAKELLVKKKADGSYHFVHDMVRQTVYGGIEKKDRVIMLKELTDTLIARTVEGRRDSVLFVIVDLINRVRPTNTPIAEERVCYAKLLRLAGEKAIQTPDFPTAFEYFESGISFLGDGLWGDEYELSLALCTKAAAAGCAIAKTHLVKQRLAEVFVNAKCYEDKLESKHLLIESLVVTGSLEEALKHSLEVLDYLGEPISNDFDDEAVRDELTNTRKCVHQIRPSLDNLPPMKDPQKIKAMIFLRLALASCYQQISRFFAIGACRMIKLTISHGLHELSGVAMAALSYAYTTVLKDYTEGHKLGKLAFMLNKEPKYTGDIAAATMDVTSIFKEPIQALLPSLLEAHKAAFKRGTMLSAFQLLHHYCFHSFLSGSPLNALDKEVKSFLCLMSRHKIVRHYLILIPMCNFMSKLSGAKKFTHCDRFQEYEDNASNIKHAFEKKDISRCGAIITLEVVEHFIFRRMDSAERILRQYQDFFDLHERVVVQFHAIHRTLYSGLIAFYLFRESGDQFWMDRGMTSQRKYERWTRDGCQWNFENKYLLLTAELHSCIGEIGQATEMYQRAIASARDHRFIHEEAIANELAGYFHSEKGTKDISAPLLERAIVCYRTWGAKKKAYQLQQTLLSMSN
ncbi:hypothetical protein ACHAWF_016069 [Thalassiosira exigua]